MEDQNLKLLRSRSGVHLDCFFREYIEFVLHGERQNLRDLSVQIAEHTKGGKTFKLALGDESLLLLPVHNADELKETACGMFFECPIISEQDKPFMQLCFFGNTKAFDELKQLFDLCSVEDYDGESYELDSYSTSWVFPTSVALKVYTYTSVGSFKSSVQDHDVSEYPESLAYMKPHLSESDPELYSKINHYFLDSIARKQMISWIRD